MLSTMTLSDFARRSHFRKQKTHILFELGVVVELHFTQHFQYDNLRRDGKSGVAEAGNAHSYRNPDAVSSPLHLQCLRLEFWLEFAELGKPLLPAVRTNGLVANATQECRVHIDELTIHYSNV